LSLCLPKHHVKKRSGGTALQHILILWMELRGIFQTSVVLPSENWAPVTTEKEAVWVPGPVSQLHEDLISLYLKESNPNSSVFRPIAWSIYYLLRQPDSNENCIKIDLNRKITLVLHKNYHNTTFDKRTLLHAETKRKKEAFIRNNSDSVFLVSVQTCKASLRYIQTSTSLT
jgi:hypothetical protein